jgi:hypothetical protein
VLGILGVLSPAGRRMVAIELGLIMAISQGWSCAHFLVNLDNMGVIGALSAGRSQNLKQNWVLQRIVATSRINNIWLTSKYVASAKNIADTLLRGVPHPPMFLSLHVCILSFT